MKIIGVFILVAFYIFVNGGPQHKYTLKHKGIVESYNRSLGKLTTFYANNTGDVQFTIGVAFKIYSEYFKDKVMAKAKLFREVGKDNYVPLYDMKPASICQVFKSNALGPVPFNWTGLMAYGNITVCDLKPHSFYYIDNYTASDEYYPPRLPTGKYMIDIKMSKQSFVLVSVKWYAVVAPKKS